MKLIKSKENEMNNALIKKYFLVQNLGHLLKKMDDLKNNSEKNKQLVNVIESGLSNFENEIENMSEKEKEIEKPYKIVDTIEKILAFNRQQQGQGLKF